jgi:hypothetical protein
MITEFIPRLLQHLDNKNIDPLPIFNFLDSMITPMFSQHNSEQLSAELKKYYYIDMILNVSIMGLNNFNYSLNVKILKLINKILRYVPLVHSQYYSQIYKTLEPQGSYNDFVSGKLFIFFIIMNNSEIDVDLKNTDEDAYYFHEFYQNVENRTFELFNKILSILEYIEKPSKKGRKIKEFNIEISSVVRNMLQGMTDELFNAILQKFIQFIHTEVYSNATPEIKKILKIMTLKSRKQLLKITMNLTFGNLIKKEKEAKSTTSSHEFLQKLKCYEKSKFYSISESISKEKFEYYFEILNAVIR